MSHTCHAKLCAAPCRPELLMCLRHWRMVPKALQRRVYETYRPGQCDDKLPSREWREAADAAIASVALKEGCPPGKLKLCEVRALLKLHRWSLGDDAETMEIELRKLDATRETG